MRTSFFHHVRFALAALVYFCLTVSAAAQTSPEISRGVQWLASQIQADGSLFDEPRSIATALQSRSEAAYTLKLLATVPANLTAGIDAEPEDNTEYISRKVISLAINGWDTTAYVNLLLQRQNADGGFGGAPEYGSNVLDTA